MQKIINFIEKYFWLILIIGGIIGLVLPDIFLSWKNSLVYLLGFVLLLSFLKINTKEFLTYFKKPVLISWLVLVQMIILPALFFLLIKNFNWELAIAVLIILGVPPGVAAPAIVDIFKGNVPLAIMLTVLAHLIVPLTLPLLFLILIGEKIEISVLEIFIYIAKVVILPFLLSLIIKKFFYKTINKTQKYFKSITIIAITVIILVAIAINAEYITSQPQKAFLYLIILSGLAAFLHLIGEIISIKQNKKTAVTNAVCLSYNNMALGLLIAMEFFNPQIVFYCVCYEVVWNILPIISKMMFKNKIKN